MVDPNRKINRLTDKDIEFLDECEQEFPKRFTDEDEDFVEHCSKPYPDPPVVENWRAGDSGSSGSGSHSNHNRDDGQRNFRGGGNHRGYNRGWHRRVGRHDNNRRFRPYQRDDNQDQKRQHHDRSPPEINRGREQRADSNRDDEQRPESSRAAEQRRGSSRIAPAPMSIRRDYGNFVPASKD